MAKSLFQSAFLVKVWGCEQRCGHDGSQADICHQRAGLHTGGAQGQTGSCYCK